MSVSVRPISSSAALVIIWTACLALPIRSGAQETEPPEPVIDVHVHTLPLSDPGRREDLTGLRAPRTLDELRRRNIEVLRRHGVVRALASGADLAFYLTADSALFAPGLRLNAPVLAVDSLRTLFGTGAYLALAEWAPQYDAIAPNDPRLESYFALAEELDIPIGLHVGLRLPDARSDATCGMGPSGTATLSDPMLLDGVLTRHSRLRLFVMHAGWPMLDRMLALLDAHPQLYVDISFIDWVIPRDEFHAYLRALVDAGHGERIMFGSDQMLWPEALPLALEAVRTAEFLSPEQKRDILFHNAVRFFRWGDLAHLRVHRAVR
ncbi:MAG: amidohydrolase family protein [Gemmatimonadaceae bacterium]